ncbi:MAG: hypothetical protein R2695_21235 [Acidimicrobiales bacterium]
MCAVDDDWSGLKLMVRRERRGPERYRPRRDRDPVATAPATTSSIVGFADLLDGVEPADRELVFELMVSAMRLAREDVDRGELKMMASALKEFRYSFGVFAPYEEIRKHLVRQRPDEARRPRLFLRP